MDRRFFVVVALVALLGLLVVPAVSNAAELKGTVKSVDAAKHSMVVTGADKMDHNVTWDTNTKVTGGKAEDLKAGVHVTVTHEGGKASAIAIEAAAKK